MVRSGRRRGGGRFLAQHLGDLGHDRQRDLGRRDGVDGEPDGSVDAGDLGFGEAGLAQAVHPLAVGLPAAQEPT